MKCQRRSHGQSMLEFSLVLPLMLVVIILFIELGRVVYYYSALSNAVREGARFGVANLYASSADRLAQIQDKVVGYAIWMPLSGDDVSVSCDAGDDDNPCDESVTVSADLQIVPILGFSAQVLGAGTTWNLSAESTMQMTPYGSCEECE